MTSRSSEGAGFTLIEVLVVVVLLAITAAVATVAIAGSTSSDINAACSNDFHTVQSALDTYRSQMGTWPTAGSNGIPAGATDSVPYLLQSYNGVGPWLKNSPADGTHYSIEAVSDGVAADGLSKVEVSINGGAPQASCTGVS